MSVKNSTRPSTPDEFSPLAENITQARPPFLERKKAMEFFFLKTVEKIGMSMKLFIQLEQHHKLIQKENHSTITPLFLLRGAMTYGLCRKAMQSDF